VAGEVADTSRFWQLCCHGLGVQCYTYNAGATHQVALRNLVRNASAGDAESQRGVADTVGRSYYENAAPPSAGYRSGYRRGRLATAERPIEYGVQQVADRAEPFASRVRAGLARRMAELERLGVEMFARRSVMRAAQAC